MQITGKVDQTWIRYRDFFSSLARRRVFSSLSVRLQDGKLGDERLDAALCS